MGNFEISRDEVNYTLKKRELLKVVDFLLGDEDKLLKIWKVGGLAECQLELVHTQSKKGSLLSHSDV